MLHQNSGANRVFTVQLEYLLYELTCSLDFSNVMADDKSDNDNNELIIIRVSSKSDIPKSARSAVGAR